MTLESLYTCCIAKPGAEETFPFDESTLVFKVGGKMFALVGLDAAEPMVNLKCDPERAVALRAEYEGILPGWHMSKTHWNSVKLDSDVPASLVRELVDHSYDLVVASLPRSRRPETGA